MKKKLIGLFGIAACTVTLASCGVNELYTTSKDFDVTMPEVDSRAKLATEEEKNKIVEENYSYEPTLDELDSYAENYSSLVSICKDYKSSDEGSSCHYSKLIFDYKNQKYWFYEKYTVTKEDTTYTNEVETKIIYKDDKYTAKTSLTLDNYKYWEYKSTEVDGMTFEYMDYYTVSGKAEFYTTFSSEYGDGKFFLPYATHYMYGLSKGIPALAAFSLYKKSELYISNNYSYCKYVNEDYDVTRVISSKDDYFGKYDKGSNYETYYEYYLSKNDLLDDSMSLEMVPKYNFEDTTYSKNNKLPYFPLNGEIERLLFGLLDIVDSIPRDLYESNFTVE